MLAEKTPVEGAVDPITFEVIRHKLRAIIGEQEITLKSVSGSPIVTEASDFSNGICLADGSALMLGRQALAHADSVANMVRNTIADCEDNPGINAGDQFIVNDPWKGAIHQSDVGIVAPIFYEGKRIGWAGSLAHQIDVGGMEFGSWCPKAVDRYQEGVIIPPVKMVENGKLRQDIWNMIMSSSRLPFLLGLDLRAMIAANNVARRRFAALIERYGLDKVLGVANGLLEHSERRLRERLKELPDGVYRAVDFIDHDGHENRVYKVNLALTKEGDSLTFDFSGSSPQAPGFINCTHTGLPGAALGAVYPILAYDIPWNDGLARTVKIVAPKGMVCNAEPPAPTSAAVCATAWVALNAATAAVSKLVSCSDKYRKELEAVANGSFVTLNLGGLNQYGEPFGTMLLDAMAGGSGAYSFKDGFDGMGVFWDQIPNIANVETNENFAPILYLHRRFIPDTGGPGAYRGGRTAGLAFTIHDANFLEAVLVGHGVEVPNSSGLHGGMPGSCNVNTLVRSTDILERFKAGEFPTNIQELNGERIDLGAKPGRFMLSPGDVLEYTWQGGGGYGDPLDRDPALVLKDVARGAVSLDTTASIYGVKNDPMTMDVEAAGTAQLRDRMRKERAKSAGTAASSTNTGGADPKPVMRLGAALELAEVAGKKVVRCRCGHQFGPATENWKANAAELVVPPTAAGPLVKLHAELEMREYACPTCGTLHSVDIAYKEGPPLWDIEIKV